MSKVRVRIAPSPTGDPHVGTAYAALFNFVFAKKMGGKFILRIEDTDRVRLVEGATEQIIKSLKWLGLFWDEGPDAGGPHEPYLQSERLPIYQKYAHELVDGGGAYYCFCSPARLEKMRLKQREKHLPPMYDGHCRQLKIAETKIRTQKEPFVVRLKIPGEGETKFTDLIRGEVVFQNTLIDDQVLLKSDGFPTYHLGVVVDDHLMEISHVIRAEEWLSSTPKHIMLYKAFGWPQPKFAHLPLLRNPDHSKISKRKNPVSLIWYRKEGYLPEALLNFLGLLGFSMPGGQEIFTPKEMIKSFSFERIVKSGPVFNLEKLDWLNGEYIRQKSLKEFAELIIGWAKEVKVKIRARDNKHLLQVLALIQERIKKLSEFDRLTDFFFIHPGVDLKLLCAGQKKAEVKMQLVAAFEALKNFNKWQNETLEKLLRQVAGDLSLKPGSFFMTLRVALTGKTATPPLFETMEVLGKETVLLRLEKLIGSI